jgi:hypothetical protein
MCDDRATSWLADEPHAIIVSLHSKQSDTRDFPAARRSIVILEFCEVVDMRFSYVVTLLLCYITSTLNAMYLASVSLFMSKTNGLTLVTMTASSLKPN